MPKINVYLPDALAERVRAAGLPISSICQAALTEALAQTTSWQDAITDSGQELPAEITFDRPITRHLAQALHLAQSAALSRGQSQLSPEHLLLGLLEEGENLALKVLEVAGADHRALTRKVRSTLPREEAHDHNGVSPSLSLRAAEIVEWSTEEAVKTARPFVGTEHFLVGILRDQTSPAGKALRAAGLDLERTRTAIQNMLTGSTFAHWNTNAVQQASVERRLGELAAKIDELHADLLATRGQ